MAYNHSLSMANIVNVVEALNRGGMQSCDDLMSLVWINAAPAQLTRKINAPSRPALRTLEYARTQVRQEIRRTLHNHFNDLGGSHYHISRATAYGDVERFWVSESNAHIEQEMATSGNGDITPEALSEGEVFTEGNNTVIGRLIQSLEEHAHA